MLFNIFSVCSHVSFSYCCFSFFSFLFISLVQRKTARKIVFPRSSNIMKSSKRTSKHYLYINFLAKKDFIFHHRKAQSKNFLVAQTKNFSVISKYHLSIDFLSKKPCICYNGKAQSKYFSVSSKYHLSINFLPQKETVFFIPEKFKTKTFQ